MHKPASNIVPYSAVARRRRTRAALRAMQAYFQAHDLPRAERKRLESQWLQAVRALRTS